MRIFLNIAACILLGVMLTQPMLVADRIEIPHASDLALVALGLAGVMLGRRGGYRVSED